MISTGLTGAMLIALVTGDQTTMRAAPDTTAPQQAVLWKGDWLEVRGQLKDYLRVWDHRRERPGYVQLSLVKQYLLDKNAAPTFRALVEYLQDSAGEESLGIGYAALYLKVAPPESIDGWIFTALGRMAHNLAHRASVQVTSQRATHLSAHLDVASSYGVRFLSFEVKDHTRVCYDGEAFRRALALTILPEDQALATLALTDPACLHPDLSPPQQRELRTWFLSLLNKTDPTGVAPHLGNRLRLRSSQLASVLAYDLSRRGQHQEAGKLAKQALASLLRVDKIHLARRDEYDYDRAAMLAAASRWAGMSAPKSAPQGLWLRLTRQDTGETCVSLDTGQPKDKGLQRCTYGLVREASIRRSRSGRQLAIVVQHLPGWQELWIFHKPDKEWLVTPLVPAITEPHLGYVELAGWTPGDQELLVVREAMIKGTLHRRFQALRSKDFAVRLDARSLDLFKTFKRWRSPEWTATTLALR